ncbi:MAG: right-handed parallel beta-helix repeat-containing protein [Candidatus Eisenbacteria bacterium]|uniref:Right-handed parallel beta-helix repeat-containing protein n=1 Tax=Eiseniibacteriota bacterium TaxID=2212470 RepID=A0A956LWI1_UNCEI|nr:right-handed parallel beta-helix repeat-containing protein [Candidatus Eisenbacteria bacterium]
MPTIQAALDAAAPGDTVFVAAGTYTGPGNRNLDSGGKDLVVRSEAGAELTVLDCGNVARGFRFVSGETAAAVVDGFTILRGRATFEGSVGSNAGGAFLILDSSPTIRNCVTQECGFDSNGGGVGPAAYVARGTPRFSWCRIVASEAGFEGNGAGAIFGESPILEDCLFQSNVAGVHLEGTSTVTRCRFEVNASVNQGGAAVVWGDVVLTDCVFRFNSVNSRVGSAPAYGGGAIALNGNVRFERCEFYDNFSEGFGAGLAVLGGATVVDCVFEGNYAGPDFFGVEAYGGAGLFTEGENVVTGCLIVNNRAEGRGAGLHARSPLLQLDRCTIAANYASGDDGFGGGFALTEGGSADADRILVWGNCADQASPAGWVDSGTGLDLTCSDLVLSDVGGTGIVTPDAFTFEADPGFCDARICLDSPQHGGSYDLAANSPCAASESPCGERIGARDPGCGAMGACCLPDLECRWLLESDCAVMGHFLGEGVPCEPGICSVTEAPEASGLVSVRVLENPSAGAIALSLTIPSRSMVDLRIVDARGRTVHTMRAQVEGRRDVRWDPGRSGVFFYDVRIGTRTFRGKVVHLDRP